MRKRLPRVIALASKCRLCPRECKVDRTKGDLGKCKISYGPVFSSANLHHGEEPPISGIRGSGTIFLTGCNLKCKFCQNYPISQLRHGNTVSTDHLADEMIRLQDEGAHNINFVSPTHQTAAIYESVLNAYKKGLNIPLVYNSGGYDSLKMLKLWDGIVDIYMPDSKYGSDEPARKISGAKNYTKYNRIALIEMYRQVGDLCVDANGIAVSGLIVRHLVLPHNISKSKTVLKNIAKNISINTYISLMSQYFPAYEAHYHHELKDRVNIDAYNKIVNYTKELGLENGWIQPY